MVSVKYLMSIHHALKVVLEFFWMLAGGCRNQYDDGIERRKVSRDVRKNQSVTAPIALTTNHAISLRSMCMPFRMLCLKGVYVAPNDQS